MDDVLQRIIGECLSAAASDRFIPEWEFHTLFGLHCSDVAAIAAAWPDVDQKSESVILAINNSFNNLLGYPIDHPQEWSRYISVPRSELDPYFRRWCESAIPTSATDHENAYFSMML